MCRVVDVSLLIPFESHPPDTQTTQPFHSAVGQRLRLVTHSFEPQYAESLYGIAPEGILVELDPARRIPDTRLRLVPFGLTSPIDTDAVLLVDILLARTTHHSLSPLLSQCSVVGSQTLAIRPTRPRSTSRHSSLVRPLPLRLVQRFEWPGDPRAQAISPPSVRPPLHQTHQTLHSTSRSPIGKDRDTTYPGTYFPTLLTTRKERAPTSLVADRDSHCSLSAQERTATSS